MNKEGLHRRARVAGVNTALYWIFRTPLEIALRLYWRANRLGRAHIPAHGPVIIVSNHRSFFDPWVIGTMARRPVYYMAKKELFRYRPLGWLLNSLGAFPVSRGEGDVDTMDTARQLLARGEIVLLFAEGTRTRPGPLGRPKRGFARLALQCGAAVVPVAIIGTERVRRRFWLAPDKITVRAGAAVWIAADPASGPGPVAALTDRIWQQVELQWRSIGGEPSPDRIEATDRERASAAPDQAMAADIRL